MIPLIDWLLGMLSIVIYHQVTLNCIKLPVCCLLRNRHKSALYTLNKLSMLASHCDANSIQICVEAFCHLLYSLFIYLAVGLVSG